MQEQQITHLPITTEVLQLKLLQIAQDQVSRQDPLERVYADRKRSGEPALALMGHLKTVSPNILCGCIAEAWEAIPEELIMEALKQCSISNALNDTDDNAVWNKCGSLVQGSQ